MAARLAAAIAVGLQPTRHRSRHLADPRTTPGHCRWRSSAKLLSLSFWRDEVAISQWRGTAAHRSTQAAGRGGVFRDFGLSIAEVGHVDTQWHRARPVPAPRRDREPDQAPPQLRILRLATTASRHPTSHASSPLRLQQRLEFAQPWTTGTTRTAQIKKGGQSCTPIWSGPLWADREVAQD